METIPEKEKRPRGPEGSTYKAKDSGRWVARYRYTDDNGRYRERKRYCLTHKQARAKIQELKAEAEAEALRADGVTFRQLDAFFRAEYVHEAKFVGGQKVSGFRQSVDTVNRYLDVALEFVGDRDINLITYADLQAFKGAVLSTPTQRGGKRSKMTSFFAPRTQQGGQRSVSDTNHFLKRLRRLFAVATEQGWLTVNPFNRGSSLIADSFEVQRTRILSSDEESRLMIACQRWRKHIVPLIIFAIETGCRRGEIQSVKWSAVNFDRRFITIESANTKTLRSRMVPMSARLVETILQLKETALPTGNDFIFGPADFKKGFNAACSAAGLDDLRFHDLRHTAITRMLEKGISPPLVMKISGHTQYKTFLRYVNQSENSLYEIALRLDAAA